jgi:hypothetical protein
LEIIFYFPIILKIRLLHIRALLSSKCYNNYVHLYIERV